MPLCNIFTFPSTEEEAVALQLYNVLHQECVCPSGHPMALSFAAQIHWRCMGPGPPTKRGHHKTFLL